MHRGDDDDDEGLQTTGEIVGRNRPKSLPASVKSASVSSKPSVPEKKPNADAAETTDPAGLVVYGEFIKDELEVQDKRKASFEQRGLAVITTSGVLVTLLFALAALSTKSAASSRFLTRRGLGCRAHSSCSSSVR